MPTWATATLPDFGRRFVDMDPTELADDVVYQIGALQALAATEGARVRYVKPHGGLYNAIVSNTAQARAVVDAVKSVDPGLPILGLPGSEVLRLAEAAGLRAVSEAFADRAYNPDGTLVSRSLPGAVLHDPAEVAEHVLRMATDSAIRTVDGSLLKINADSICVHGDSPGGSRDGGRSKGCAFRRRHHHQGVRLNRVRLNRIRLTHICPSQRTASRQQHPSSNQAAPPHS